MKSLRLFLWLMVLLAGGVLLFQSFVNTPSDQSKLRSTGGTIGGNYTLTSHTGATVSNTDFKGRYQFIYFGYSYCPDVCPIELQKMTAALTLLEDQKIDTTPIQPIFISVDPDRDTSDELKRFVTGFHKNFVGLRGDAETIKKVAADYKIYFSKTGGTGENDYLMNHSNYIILMGKDGKFLKLYTAIDTPEQIANSLRQLLV